MHKHELPSVDVPLATITALSLCGYVSIRWAHFENCNFIYHSWQKRSSVIKVERLFLSPATCPQTGHRLGHSRTFKLLSWQLI